MKFFKLLGFLLLFVFSCKFSYGIDLSKKIYIKSCAKNSKCLTYDNTEVTTTFIKKKKKLNKPQEYYAICGPVREICDFKLTPILFCDSPFAEGSLNPLAVYSKNFIGKMIQDVFYYNKFTQLDKIQKEALAFSQPAPFVEKSMSAGFRNTKIKNKLLAEKKTKTYSYVTKKLAPLFNPDQLNKRYSDILYQINGPYWFSYEDMIKNKLCSGLDIVSKPKCFVQNYKKAEYIENHLRYFCSSIEAVQGKCRKSVVKFVQNIFATKDNQQFSEYIKTVMFYINLKDQLAYGLKKRTPGTIPTEANQKEANQPIGGQFSPGSSEIKERTPPPGPYVPPSSSLPKGTNEPGVGPLN